jgi:hypothetical protein
LKVWKPARISASSLSAVALPQRAIHCERYSRPLAFCPWPPLRLVQPQTARLASSTVARMPCSRARNRAVARPVKPEPTITTSASVSRSIGPSSAGGVPAVATQ